MHAQMQRLNAITPSRLGSRSSEAEAPSNSAVFRVSRFIRCALARAIAEAAASLACEAPTTTLTLHMVRARWHFRDFSVAPSVGSRRFAMHLPRRSPDIGLGGLAGPARKCYKVVEARAVQPSASALAGGPRAFAQSRRAAACWRARGRTRALAPPPRPHAAATRRRRRPG